MRPAPLTRKLLRDLLRLRWQVLAIALLIACGVAVAVMAFSSQRALAVAQADFYRRSAFADVFAVATRAPLSKVSALSAIDGVVAVDARILEAGLMDVPGLERPATARVISLPADHRASLNRIRLVQGRMPDPAQTDEVVALKTFMDAAGVRLGDRLSTVLNGRTFSFTIVGAALSPEYVYVPAPESFMPDDAHQGVFWAPRPAVERAAGMHGAFNSVALRLAPSASMPAVLAEVDRVLGPYGGRAAYARADQVSHAFLDAELKELSRSASILPPVFLVVAASLVHLVVSRLVEAEREQIGLLKAFGYSDLEASATYLQLAACIGLTGAVGGGLVGAGLSLAVVEQYREYFRFPDLEAVFHWPAFLGAAAVSVAAACLGSLGAALRAARLSPAVAMQPPRPAAYREGGLDRLFRGPAVDQATRMIVRNLERFPVRALFSGLGMAASLSLLVGTQFVFDSLDEVMDQAYYRAQRWSESVSFAEARDRSVVSAVRRLPGVAVAEPVRIVPVRLKANGREELTRLTGLAEGAKLQRPLDGRDRPVPFLGGGLVLSVALAERLRVQPGARVWVETVEGRPVQGMLPVTALATDYSGLAVYMERRELNRFLREGDVANAAQLMVAPDSRRAFYAAVEKTPQIVGAASRDETVASWRQAMTEAFRVMITFYVGFAGSIAFGVAYNTSRIALSERARDLATLRVLGFGRGECAYILLGELLVIALAAVPVGIVGGRLLAEGLILAYSRDELRLPAILTPESYGLAIAAYLIAIALAAAMVGRRIWGLDLVRVLKTRE